MNLLDRFIVNVATSLLRGVLAVGVGAVYVQMFIFGSLLLAGIAFVLSVIAKAVLSGV